MPVSKKNKIKKNNSFGLRKEKREKEKIEERQARISRNRHYDYDYSSTEILYSALQLTELARRIKK